MINVDSPSRPQELIENDLESLIQLRTGRQVSGLRVEMSPGHVVLRGRASSFYLKQIAQHCVLESLPSARLINAIIVEARSSGSTSS